ncbi:TetR/AcrR family transcriptional regulator C-terminal domain-containing protein [Micromonospora sp. M12]
MSLYRYVGSKDELLELMADAALGTPPTIPTDDWRRGLRSWAFEQRAVFQRRPWLTRVPTSGPPSGPHQIAWMEAGLAVLSGTRLDWAHKIGVLSLISGYVVQSVRQYSDLAEGRTEGQGQADAERDYGRALVRLVEPEQFRRPPGCSPRRCSRLRRRRPPMRRSPTRTSRSGWSSSSTASPSASEARTPDPARAGRHAASGGGSSSNSNSDSSTRPFTKVSKSRARTVIW